MTDIEIRPLVSQADFQACTSLQRETWGQTFGELVPPSLLKVSQRVGGVAAGAFDASGALLGFVFGLTGVEPGGRVVHWSDMLAVRPEARGRGLARRLKEFQRDAVRELGGELIYWTYDPLVARNAHLNFNIFGVEAVEYTENMYGDSGSDLHRGIGTDRIVVAWPVDPQVSEQLRARSAAVALREMPPAITCATMPSELPDAFRIEVPRDIALLQEKNMAAARACREATRPVFNRAYREGFRVTGFAAGPDGGEYYLDRASA